MKVKFKCEILENEECMIKITRLPDGPDAQWSVIVGYDPDKAMGCTIIELDTAVCNPQEFCKIYLEVHDWVVSQLAEQRTMKGEIEV